jgi:hypothetical protein
VLADVRNSVKVKPLRAWVLPRTWALACPDVQPGGGLVRFGAEVLVACLGGERARGAAVEAADRWVRLG